MLTIHVTENLQIKDNDNYLTSLKGRNESEEIARWHQNTIYRSARCHCKWKWMWWGWWFGTPLPQFHNVPSLGGLIYDHQVQWIRIWQPLTFYDGQKGVNPHQTSTFSDVPRLCLWENLQWKNTLFILSYYFSHNGEMETMYQSTYSKSSIRGYWK